VRPVGSVLCTRFMVCASLYSSFALECARFWIFLEHILVRAVGSLVPRSCLFDVLIWLQGFVWIWGSIVVAWRCFYITEDTSSFTVGVGFL